MRTWSGESQALPTAICQVGGRARTGPRSSDSQASDGPILPLKEQCLYLNQKSSHSVLPSALHPQAFLLSQLLCRRQSGGKGTNSPMLLCQTLPSRCSYQGPLLSAMGQEEQMGQARVGDSTAWGWVGCAPSLSLPLRLDLSSGGCLWGR